jgi:hypothetical protein
MKKIKLHMKNNTMRLFKILKNNIKTKLIFIKNH